MSAPLGYATLSLVPSAAGLGGAFSRDLSTSFRQHGDLGGRQIAASVTRFVGPAIIATAVAVGVAAAAKIISGTVEQAGALEQSMGAIDSVFKGSAGQMHEWAAGAAGAVGLTKNQYNELGTLIGSQLKNAGTAMEDLGPKTNTLIGQGADMAAMFGGTTKEAVEAISSALKGERDPIERYGVSLNEAKIQAQMAADAMNGVTYESEEQAKAAATLALILQQTADAQGTFGRESATYEGTMQRLSASWGNVTATIGTGFLPIATAAGSVLLGMMPGVQGLADKFAALAPAVQGVAEILLFGNFDGGLFAAFGLAEDSGFVDFLFDIREGLIALFTAGDATGLVDVFVGLVPGIAAWYAGTYVPMVWTLLGDLIPKALDWYANVYAAAALPFFTSLVLAVLHVLPNVLTTLVGLVPALLAPILGAVPMIIEATLTLFQGLITAVITVLPLVVESLITALPMIASALIEALPMIVTAALEMFMGVVQAVIEVIPVLLTTVLEMLPLLITTIVGMLPGILESGLTLFLGLVTSVLTMLPQLITTLIGILPDLVTTIVGMIPTLLTTGVELFLQLAVAVVKALPEIIGALITQVIPAIVTALWEAIPQLLQAGIDLIGGLIQGLWDAAPKVGAAILDIMGDAVDGFLDFLGIHSPSRLFKGYGAGIGQGLVESLDAAQPLVDWRADDVSEVIPDGGWAGTQQRAVALLSEQEERVMNRTRNATGLTAQQELIRAQRILKAA